MSHLNAGHTVSAILAALAAHGPLTRAELIAKGVQPVDSISSVIDRLRKPTVRDPNTKRIYIAEYKLVVESTRTIYRPVFALGSHIDAIKPANRTGRYRSKPVKTAVVSFVFNLGDAARQNV